MAWPKGKSRKPATEDGASAPAPARSWKMKAEPNWESMSDASDNPDRFHIDRELFPEGMDLQWVTDTVYGQKVPQQRADYEKKGWTPVHQEDFDGRFNGLFMQKNEEGEINNGGQVLMARPLELTIEARKRDAHAAKQQLAIKEAALRGGDIQGVGFDTQHSTVHNKVGRSWERVAVPSDNE